MGKPDHEDGAGLTALVVGKSPAMQRDSLVHAASRARAKLVFARDVAEALRWLTDPHHDPDCILVANGNDVAPVSQWVRDRARFFSVPVVALVTHPSDNTFREAYANGADDALVHGDLGGVTRRLANLESRQKHERPPANQGLAVIAFPDIARRRVLGRTLRQAGFNVSYAASAEELRRVVEGDEPPTLLITHPGFPPDGGRVALNDVRRILGRAQLPGLLLPATESEARDAEALTDSEQAGKLLFFAEEAMRAEVRDMRASARLLHYGMCAFREAGSLFPIFGLTHNISRQGLYVRTLDPPRPGSDVWFEMRAPELETAIHLRGKVMWRREPSKMGGAAPPGFGLRIEAALCPQQDLELYERGYDELCLTRSYEATLPPAASGE